MPSWRRTGDGFRSFEVFDLDCFVANPRYSSKEANPLQVPGTSVDPVRLPTQDGRDPEKEPGATGSHVPLPQPTHGSDCTFFQTWQKSSSS